LLIIEFVCDSNWWFDCSTESCF